MTIHNTNTTTTNLNPRGNNPAADTFDDACDLGQCCMDPCYYFYAKAKKVWDRRQQQSQQRQHTTAITSSTDPAATAKHTKAAFLFALQQTTYYMLIGGCWAIIFLRAFPLLDESEHISHRHKPAGVVVFVACVASWLLAKLTPPGSITQDTLWKFDNYRYDGVLYHHNDTTTTTMMCPSLQMRKLARSKYDRYSGHHVPRFDHYCGWLGNSIGEENYRFFLVFVLVHTLMALYGTCMTFALMKDAGETVLVGLKDTAAPFSGYDVFLAALRVDAWVVSTIVLMGMSLPFLISFLVFHVLLVRRGMTTNEHFKWKALGAGGNGTSAVSSRRADVEHQAGTNPCPDVCKLGSSSAQPQTQFYNLGFAGNIHEVFVPRSLRAGGVKAM